MRTECPSCGSADTVGYWEIKRNQGGAHNALFKSLYPNARICIDCEHVWWRDPIKLDLKALTVEKGDWKWPEVK